MHTAPGKLDHIWERISDGEKFQQWAFRTHKKQTECKPEAAGITIEKVNHSTHLSNARSAVCA